MKVQATKQGYYDQCLREPGEVFELVNELDGTMPIRMVRTYEMKDGKPTGEWSEVPYIDKDGNVMHRDFAPDHEEVTGRGSFRGETFAPGWMMEVSEDTEVGIYDPETRFNAVGREIAQPVQRIIKPSDQPVNAPRATPMRGKASDRQRRTVA